MAGHLFSSGEGDLDIVVRHVVAPKLADFAGDDVGIEHAAGDIPPLPQAIKVSGFYRFPVFTGWYLARARVRRYIEVSRNHRKPENQQDHGDQRHRHRGDRDDLVQLRNRCRLR